MSKVRTPLTEPYITIGRRINTYRVKRGLSYKQLFTLLTKGGCTQQSLTCVYEWEIARIRVSIADLMILADVLMVPLGALLPTIGRVRTAIKADRDE